MPYEFHYKCLVFLRQLFSFSDACSTWQLWLFGLHPLFCHGVTQISLVILVPSRLMPVTSRKRWQSQCIKVCLNPLPFTFQRRTSNYKHNENVHQYNQIKTSLTFNPAKKQIMQTSNADIIMNFSVAFTSIYSDILSHFVNVGVILYVCSKKTWAKEITSVVQYLISIFIKVY